MIQGFIDDLSQLQGRELEERFHEIARTESDCSSARKGGDLGLFGRNTMQAAFEVCRPCFSRLKIARMVI